MDEPKLPPIVATLKDGSFLKEAFRRGLLNVEQVENLIEKSNGLAPSWLLGTGDERPRATDQGSHSGRLLTTREAAEILNLKPSTLKKWRIQGIGPPFVRVGSKAVRYWSDDLLGDKG